MKNSKAKKPCYSLLVKKVCFIWLNSGMSNFLLKLLDSHDKMRTEKELLLVRGRLDPKLMDETVYGNIGGLVVIS